MNYINKKPVFLLMSALLLVFTGCNVSGSNSDKLQKVSVNMSIKSGTAPMLMAKTASAQSVDNLTEVKLLVEELELESSVDQDSLDFEVEDLVVNLPLDGSEFELVAATVPEGVYDEFEMEIDGPDDESSVNDPDFYDNSDEDGYSIVVKGVYNGENFVYRTKEEFEFELELEPPLEVTDNSSPSVAVNVDPYSWFMDSSGNALDPNDPSNQQIIEENIAKSFGAELDDDEGDNNEDDGNDESDDDDNE